MTYLEKYKKDHPGLSDGHYRTFMIKNCPYGLNGKLIHCPGDLCGIGMPNEERCPVCWNREIPETEPTNTKTNEREDGNMNNNFTKKDLKVGYVVKLRNGTLQMVMPIDRAGIEFVTTTITGQYCRSDQYTDDLLVNDRRQTVYDIMAVYGFSCWCHETICISANGRPLLWKREEKTCDSCAHKVVCTHVGMCEHYLEKAK